LAAAAVVVWRSSGVVVWRSVDVHLLVVFVVGRAVVVSTVVVTAGEVAAGVDDSTVVG